MVAITAATPHTTDPAGHDRAVADSAECALHAAHQTHDDAWIAAASERLHQAVTDYLAEHTAPDPAHPVPRDRRARR
jgi:hypothetical protein